MARSWRTQQWQIGNEVTPGLLVPANKQLMAYDFEPGPELDIKHHRASGYGVATSGQLVSEHSVGEFNGPIDFRNIVYPMSSMFGAAVITQPAAVPSPTVYQWVWTLLGKGKIVPKTFSNEWGDADGASRFAYGTFVGAELEMSRTGDNTISGDVMGQEMETGQVLTATPTEIESLPINGADWDCYMADTAAGLSGAPTQLAALYEAGMSFGDIFAPEFVMMSGEDSFKSLFDAEDPSYEWEMTLGADAVAEAMLTGAARTQARKFFRLRNTGPIIEDALPFQLTFDLCALVSDVESYGNLDGMKTLPVSYALAYDKTWAKAMVITLQTDVVAL